MIDIKTNAIRKKDLIVGSSRQWRARRHIRGVTVVYQCAEVGRVACLLATVDLTKPRVHLYERILQGRSRGAACYPLIEVNHGAKCARRIARVTTEAARGGGLVGGTLRG